MNLRTIFIMYIICTILITISTIGMFLLDKNSSVLFMLGLIIVDMITLTLMFELYKLIDKDWTKIFDLQKKIDEEKKYIDYFIEKFKIKIICIDNEIHFTSAYEFETIFNTAESLMIIIEKIKKSNDLTKYENLIDNRITFMIIMLKEYENFWDNYFTSREGTNNVSEEILKKEQQEYDMIKNKYNILKILQFLEMEFAKIVIYRS